MGFREEMLFMVMQLKQDKEAIISFIVLLIISLIYFFTDHGTIYNKLYVGLLIIAAIDYGVRCGKVA